MFTGLVTAVGTIVRAESSGGGVDLQVACPWHDLDEGESIAIDGACLTVTSHAERSFTVHVIVTSLERTRFREYVDGQRVNLERALRAGDRLGGHLVQGHVDGVAEIVAVAERADARVVDLAVPSAVADATVPMGSIAIDGVSLTVNAVPAAGIVQVALIPFTLEHTTLGERRPGDRVHVEGDAVGKYVQQMLAVHRSARGA